MLSLLRGHGYDHKPYAIAFLGAETLHKIARLSSVAV